MYVVTLLDGGIALVEVREAGDVERYAVNGYVYVIEEKPLRLLKLRVKEARRLLAARRAARGRRGIEYYVAAAMFGKDPGEVSEAELAAAARHLLEAIERVPRRDKRLVPGELLKASPVLRKARERFGDKMPLSYHSLYRFLQRAGRYR